jgi:hypothetical protein
MSLSKRSTSSGVGSNGGRSYEILSSQVRRTVFRAHSFFKTYGSEDERSRRNFWKCEDITEDEESVEDNSDVTDFGGRI